MFGSELEGQLKIMAGGMEGEQKKAKRTRNRELRQNIQFLSGWEGGGEVLPCGTQFPEALLNSSPWLPRFYGAYCCALPGLLLVLEQVS